MITVAHEFGHGFHGRCLGDKKMIKELQKRLKEQNIKFYYVPTDDDHQSEIVGEHDQFRKYLSGFTGSAGVLVVGQEEAWLWTDGRYFIQAEKELYPGIKLIQMMPKQHVILIN